MMKHNHLIFVEWQRVILVLLGLFYGLLGPSQAFAERRSLANDTVLLLQQTDPEAGIVTPDIGVHYFVLNSEVALTAVPKPGYRFLYWIGEVTDPTANRTIAYLDTPKIIIAVFERSEYGFLPKVQLQNTLGLRGGLRGRVGDYARQGGSPVVKPVEYEWPTWDWNLPGPPSEPELPDEFPVPQVPELPEPATVLFLGLGSLVLVGSRTKRQNRLSNKASDRINKEIE